MICLFFSATCCIVKVAQHFRWMQILFVKLTIYFDELWVSMKWIFQNAKSCFFLCWKLKIRKEFQEIKSLSSIQNMAAIVYENIHEKYTYFSYDSVQLNTLLMRARNFFLDTWVSQDIEIKIDKENVVGTFNLLWHIHGTQDIRDTEVQLYMAWAFTPHLIILTGMWSTILSSMSFLRSSRSIDSSFSISWTFLDPATLYSSDISNIVMDLLAQMFLGIYFIYSCKKIYLYQKFFIITLSTRTNSQKNVVNLSFS